MFLTSSRQGIWKSSGNVRLDSCWRNAQKDYIKGVFVQKLEKKYSQTGIVKGILKIGMNI